MSRRRPFESRDLDDDSLDVQRRRLQTVGVDDRLQEVIAWSAALLADELARSGSHAPADAELPVGLGSRRP